MLTTHEPGKVWQDCLEYISRRIKKQSYATWLRHTYGGHDNNGGLQITVPNRFVADWIKEHYAGIIEEAIMQSCGELIPFCFHVNEQAQRQTELELGKPHSFTPEPVNRPTTPRPQQGMLNNRYTFESLVVGNFNQFPYAAAMAVAEAPGKTNYNPLYIYGGVGLGKTHLLQAIGNHIIEHDPSKKVIYATSEKFTSDFINSISTNTISDFINMYRSVDVLLIDDAQFFSGKESTQEQFFHTFNALYNIGKQIVLSSDRAPKDIKGMEERLLSRFFWGLVTDIQRPDLETRMAILQRKVENEDIIIREDVISYIADSVTSNIRELEGSLIRLLAYASLRGKEINVDMARNVLSGTFGVRKRPVSVEAIKKHVAEDFGITVDLLSAKKKTQNIALARQAAMYLTRSMTKNSLKAIGDTFGGRDHSTVIHACNLIERMIGKDADFHQRLQAISNKISGSC